MIRLLKIFFLKIALIFKSLHMNNKPKKNYKKQQMIVKKILLYSKLI